MSVLSSRAVKVCQNQQIMEKCFDKRKEIEEYSTQKSGNEQKCRLVIFLSSVSRRFRLVARFAYTTKENIKKKNRNFVLRALKQVGNVFSPRGYQPEENPTLVKYSNGGR